jgi:ABC-type nickel/cobalt efflux system permease component RcnA
MKRIFNYIMAGLSIVAAFCLAFTIVVVLIAKDHDRTQEISERWMPYITLILVIALPAVLIWGIFRVMRNRLFKNIRRDELDQRQDSEDKLS